MSGRLQRLLINHIQQLGFFLDLINFPKFLGWLEIVSHINTFLMELKLWLGLILFLKNRGIGSIHVHLLLNGAVLVLYLYLWGTRHEVTWGLVSKCCGWSALPIDCEELWHVTPAFRLHLRITNSCLRIRLHEASHQLFLWPWFRYLLPLMKELIHLFLRLQRDIIVFEAICNSRLRLCGSHI